MSCDNSNINSDKTASVFEGWSGQSRHYGMWQDDGATYVQVLEGTGREVGKKYEVACVSCWMKWDLAGQPPPGSFDYEKLVKAINRPHGTWACILGMCEDLIDSLEPVERLPPGFIETLEQENPLL